jgi:hypothetical protein
MRAHRIGRRRFLFKAPQPLCRLEVINIVPPIEIGRRGRSYRVDGSLWAIEKALVCYRTLGTKATIIDFGFGGTRVVISQQDNWIFYAILEKLVRLFPQQRVVGVLTWTPA